MHDHPLKSIVALQKRGIPAGICSICSASEYVIEAAMEKALKNSGVVLIEATANQVNQYGGYTGMKPAGFRDFVFSLAQKVSFPKEKIILGGDHLGPLIWKGLPAEKAMEESIELIRQYILAGFNKIHIDTSMRLGGDDPDARPDMHLIAERGAILCEAAERAFAKLREKEPDSLSPVYIIGSEVPVPGGSQEEESGIHVTKAADFIRTVNTFKEAFYRRNLMEAWENVIAVVVQPGVEFGDENIHDYNRTAARELTEALREFPNLVFEGHSTDYQTSRALKEMVEDGIVILKVGPALTFALREGLYALNHMEDEIFRYAPEIQRSNFIEALDHAMFSHPENWQAHYHGNAAKIRYARKYSLSDRCRYYLPLPEVKESMELLIQNLRPVKIPLTLINQFMPVQYIKIRNGALRNSPEELIKDRIVNVLDDYYSGLPDFPPLS